MVPDRLIESAEKIIKPPCNVVPYMVLYEQQNVQGAENMGQIRTVAGIFRAMGNEEARQFIARFVDQRVLNMRSKAEIIRYLEANKRTRWSEKTLAEEAIENYNHMRLYGYSLAARYK